MRPVLNQDSLFLSTNNYLLDYKIYPNPFHESVNIDIQAYDKKHITLFDVSGKLVYSLVTSERHISIPKQNLNPGIYFLRINIKDKQIYDKLIVR